MYVILSGINSFGRILRNSKHQFITEAKSYSEPCQTSKMEHLKPLFISVKQSILDISEGSEYASVRSAREKVHWTFAELCIALSSRTLCFSVLHTRSSG